MHHVTKGNLFTGVSINCTEIAFSPYGCVLTIDFDGEINFLNDITKFKEYDFNKKTDLAVSMFQLPTYMPFPLDYRKKEEVEVDIEDGIEVATEIEKELESRKIDKKTSSQQ